MGQVFRSLVVTLWRGATAVAALLALCGGASAQSQFQTPQGEAAAGAVPLCVGSAGTAAPCGQLAYQAYPSVSVGTTSTPVMTTAPNQVLLLSLDPGQTGKVYVSVAGSSGACQAAVVGQSAFEIQPGGSLLFSAQGGLPVPQCIPQAISTSGTDTLQIGGG